MAGNHGVEYASYSSGQCFFFDEMRMEITLPRKVSIPYSSGQCFFFKSICTFLDHRYKVSIPYSSGQCFFSLTSSQGGASREGKFQSLIHQVSVSFLDTTKYLKNKYFEFQSLIHQVSVSFSRYI